jgi:hypothetical protein
MDALIQEAKETHFDIHTTLSELANDYKGLIIRQYEIYNTICLGVAKIERAQFLKHSNIVIQSQVIAANVQAAFAVIKNQSTESY